MPRQKTKKSQTQTQTNGVLEYGTTVAARFGGSYVKRLDRVAEAMTVDRQKQQATAPEVKRSSVLRECAVQHLPVLEEKYDIVPPPPKK